MCHGVEIITHVKCVDVAHTRECEVKLQCLLAMTSDLHRDADGLTFPLLHLCQLRQQRGSVVRTSAKEESDPCPYQRGYSAVVVTAALGRTRRLSYEGTLNKVMIVEMDRAKGQLKKKSKPDCNPSSKRVTCT